MEEEDQIAWIPTKSKILRSSPCIYYQTCFFPWKRIWRVKAPTKVTFFTQTDNCLRKFFLWCVT